MSAPSETTLQLDGGSCRVWEKGAGEPLGFLAGLGGLTKWPPLLDLLAQRRRVIVPSLPGYPGGPPQDKLDCQLDWAIAAQELLAGAGLEGADLIGVSTGGALAAEVAAIWRTMVKRLVLIAPFGLFDVSRPVLDIFALQPGTLADTVCAHPAVFRDLAEAPEGADEVEWHIAQVKAGEAAARMLWPLGDTRLAKRLPRITQATLIVWGSEDKVIPPDYAQRFAAGIRGETKVCIIPGAGHLADLDAPGPVSEAVLDFLA